MCPFSGCTRCANWVISGRPLPRSVEPNQPHKAPLMPMCCSTYRRFVSPASPRKTSEKPPIPSAAAMARPQRPNQLAAQPMAAIHSGPSNTTTAQGSVAWNSVIQWERPAYVTPTSSRRTSRHRDMDQVALRCSATWVASVRSDWKICWLRSSSERSWKP
ncbi:hypothetical protein D3C72_1471740 [compost metagenome]